LRSPARLSVQAAHNNSSTNHGGGEDYARFSGILPTSLARLLSHYDKQLLAPSTDQGGGKRRRGINNNGSNKQSRRQHGANGFAFVPPYAPPSTLGCRTDRGRSDTTSERTVSDMARVFPSHGFFTTFRRPKAFARGLLTGRFPFTTLLGYAIAPNSPGGLW